MTDDRSRRGDAADRSMQKDWRVWGIALCLVCTVIAIGLVLWVTNLNNELVGIEKRDRLAMRATAYRLCARAQVDRAFAQSRVGAQDKKALAAMQRVDGLPILDCRPNLIGKGAKVFSLADQRHFVQQWEQGTLTPAELGICPQSRIGDIASAETC
jgi:hypothetical protein